MRMETINAKITEASEKRRREIETEKKERIQALNDYLKEYGTIQEQRAAINAEYDQKIADTDDAIQKASLEKQKERLLAELNMTELKDSINWKVVFNDLDKLSTSALDDLKDKLRTALEDNDISAENAKVLSEKILEIENRISDKANIWGSIIPALKERQRLVNEVLSAESEIDRLQKEQGNASQKKEDALKNFTNIIGIDPENFKQMFGEINAESLETINSFYNIDNASQQVKDAFANLHTTTFDLSKAQEELTAAQKNGLYVNDLLKQMTGKGAKDQNLGSAIKSIFSNAVEANGGGFMGVASLVQQNANSMSEFVDKIGLAGTDFGEAVHGFNEGVNGFMGAIQSLASGDIFGAVSNVISGVTGLVKGFSSIFTGSLDNHEEMVERQQEANMQLELINDHVSRISSQLEKSYGINAMNTYEELKNFLVSSQQQYNKGVQAAGDDRYGGNHSEWWHRNKNGGEGSGGFVDRIKKEYGLDFNGTSWQDFFDYLATLQDGKGAEILSKIRDNTNLMDVWDELMRKNSYDEGAIAEWVTKWADSYEDIKEAKEQLAEQITTTTEEDVFGNFLNSLYDLADGSKTVFDDIAKEWQEMVNKMVINNLVGENFRNQLSEWYKKLYEANEKRLKDNDNQSFQQTLNALKEEYNQYAKDAKEHIEQLREMNIIKTTDEAVGQQSASVDVIQRITVDQADELIGRMNAGQMIWQIGNNQRDLIIQNIAAMSEVVSGGGRSLGEMVSLMQTANGHLADIKSYSKKIYDEFGEQIAEVIKQIKESNYA